MSFQKLTDYMEQEKAISTTHAKTRNIILQMLEIKPDNWLCSKLKVGL